MTTDRLPNIAIDGLAASGKTTVAVQLAQQLGYQFLDTGLMYRTVAYQALQLGCPLVDCPALHELLANLDLSVQNGRMILAGRDVTNHLHQSEISRATPLVAALTFVRQNLVSRQQALAVSGGLVMVGRDIATVVLPQAELKVFLTAALAERAQRRFAELSVQAGVTLEQVQTDLAERDRADTERADSPLVCVADARVLDTTGLTRTEVLQQLSQWINEVKVAS